MDKQLIAELCGCCEPPTTPTPLLIANRPGLTAIAYRIGTFAAFREAMLEAIARQPALQGLTTRQSDDPGITLLELWAAVADVLTFYQERIANEAFLRTAIERGSSGSNLRWRSVFRLPERRRRRTDRCRHAASSSVAEWSGPFTHLL